MAEGNAIELSIVLTNKGAVVNNKIFKRIIILIFILLTGFGEAGHSETLIWSPPELLSIIKEGLSLNKEIKSMEFNLESLKENIPAVGSLPDPRLSLSVLNLPASSFKFDEQAMTQKQISIAQKLPWMGKLDLYSKKAEISAMKFESILNAKKNSLSRKIAALYYDLGIIISSQKTNLKLIDMVKQISHIAETRYSTGRGLQQDIFQAQVELSKLMDEKINLDKMYHLKELKLNELLNRICFSPVKAPFGLKEPDFIINSSDIKKMAVMWNPQLKVKKLEVDESKINVNIALKNYWPDIDVKLAYGQRDEDVSGKKLDDFFSASVTIPIPVWQNTKQDKKLAFTKKKLKAASSSYQSFIESLPYKIDALVTEIENLKNSYLLYQKTLVVQAAQWAKSTLSGYEVGKIEFNTMVNARIRLLRFELQAETYLFNIYKKQWELLEIIGRPLQSTINDTKKDNINE